MRHIMLGYNDPGHRWCSLHEKVVCLTQKTFFLEFCFDLEHYKKMQTAFWKDKTNKQQKTLVPVWP